MLAVVTALLGVLLGLVIGRRSKATEMAERERVLREVLPEACYIRRQVELGEQPHEPRWPGVGEY